MKGALVTQKWAYRVSYVLREMRVPHLGDAQRKQTHSVSHQLTRKRNWLTCRGTLCDRSRRQRRRRTTWITFIRMEGCWQLNWNLLVHFLSRWSQVYVRGGGTSWLQRWCIPLVHGGLNGSCSERNGCGCCVTSVGLCASSELHDHMVCVRVCVVFILLSHGRCSRVWDPHCHMGSSLIQT